MILNGRRIINQSINQSGVEKYNLGKLVQIVSTL